ncbi:cytochrome P450 [Podospora didyma]|uniref:Cytochrome P450 n=1 Tax=Podospora didyma TaxID=330526 RepID=A0AAE0K1E0_9PEZI|nr:cytochrome P450 [Podospora didyma]
MLLPVCLILCRIIGRARYSTVASAPVVGRGWRFEPLFLTRYRFLLGGWAITRDGWDQYSDSVFTIVRPDANITVLPPRYLNEIQNLHDDKLHAMQALSEDMGGDYSGISILVGSHLTFNVVRNKLTPKMGAMLPLLVDELEHAMKVEIPPCKGEWVSVDLSMIMTRLISRLTSRVWVGKELSRNNEWHTVNIATTENIFITALALRCLPPALHPVVAAVIPTRRRIRQGMGRVQSFLVPVIKERRRRQAEEGKLYEKPDDVLQWLMDGASDEEQAADNLAARYVYSVIGSLYTVVGALVDCLYDVSEHPEYRVPLQQEVGQALGVSGTGSVDFRSWQKGTAAKLVKMDSFMKESLRMNGPSPMSQKRIVKETLKLSDGLTLPTGAYVCMVDPSAIGRGPGDFDGFRYARLRQDPGFAERYQYTATDKDHLAFGHGRYACPGRWVAALKIKLVFAAMLERYDVSFVGESGSGGGGVARPKKLQVLELGFHDPRSRVFLRERPNIG